MYGGLKGHLERARTKYGFRVPDSKWLVDVRGLVEYCMAKALVVRRCLYCDRQFHEYTSCLQHMRASNHCRLPVDMKDDSGMDEYSVFYNYDQEDPEWTKARLERRAGRQGREAVLPEALRVKFMGAEAQLEAMEAGGLRAIEAGKEQAQRQLADGREGGKEDEGIEAATGGGESEGADRVSLMKTEEEVWMDDSDSEGEGPSEYDPELLPTGELLLPSGRVAGNKEMLDTYRKRARHGRAIDGRARQMPILEAHTRVLAKIGFERVDARAAAIEFAKSSRETRRGFESGAGSGGIGVEEMETEGTVGAIENGSGSKEEGKEGVSGASAEKPDAEEVARGVALLRSY